MQPANLHIFFFPTQSSSCNKRCTAEGEIFVIENLTVLLQLSYHTFAGRVFACSAKNAFEIFNHGLNIKKNSAESFNRLLRLE